MATTPTDDALVKSDRTVGVHACQVCSTNELKREALLFDRIAIPGYPDELPWLRDRGIVRGIPRPNQRLMRQYHDAVNAELKVMGTPVSRNSGAMLVKGNVFGTISEVFKRLCSIELCRDGINAFPILDSHRQFERVFPVGTTPVLEVVLKSMPMPDEQTPWADIIEFRNDPESMKRLQRLRVWVRKCARATTATSLAEMKEEIEVLLDEYEEQMKLYRMKVNKGATETLLTVADKVAEDFGKVRWGGPATEPFILRERHISLLEAELKAPNRELAFISMARERFSR